jgi:aminopeptidase N
MSDPYLPDSGDPAYRVTHYDLELDYRVAGNRLAGRATLTVLTEQELSRLRIDLAGLRVARVTVGGRRGVRYAHRGRVLQVSLERPVPAGTTLEVVVQYSGNPRPVVDRWGEVGWEELTDGALVASQPDGAPSWFPCNDRPAAKASFAFTVTTESAYTVVCNGALTSERVRGSRTTWTYEAPEPMATYLATVQIGRYRMLDTAMGSVRQRAAVPARLLPTFDGDFGRQDEMMTVFQRLFGPYPFGSYTVIVTDDELEIPIEAQGLSVFGANHLDGQRGSERLVAHELAHQWFGNSLTLTRWDDIWLHEGFACYAEWLWSQSSGGESADALARTAVKRLRALPQDLVLTDPGPDSMFDDRVYKRGALTLHSLRLTIGDGAFFGLLRAWTAEHRHGGVTTRLFTETAQRHAEVALDGFFRGWLRERSLPEMPARSVPQG